jgi:hypothetical protein
MQSFGWAMFVAAVVILLYGVAPTCRESAEVPADLQDASPAVERPDLLTCEIELEDAGGCHVAVLRVHNHSDIHIPVPRWTLIEGGEMTWESFRVERDGQRAWYTSKTIGRLPPTEQDMIVLAPGSTYETRADISACYDLSQPGEYRIHYYALVDLPGSDNGAFFILTSNDLALRVE